MVDAARLLRESFNGDHGVCMFHNAPFDIEVAMVHFGLEWPRLWGDTMFLAFLSNPREATLSLKPLSEKYLRRKPKERDAVFQWLLDNGVKDEKGRKITAAKAGAFISWAPGALVGRYAVADVEMTASLAQKLGTKVTKAGMYDAYKREVALAPITLSMEQTGILVDVPRLKPLEVALTGIVEKVNKHVIKLLDGAKALPEDFNVASGAQLGEALVAAGKLSKETLTATGKQSTAMSVLLETCSDKELTEALSLRSVAEKYLTGFVRPWIESAARANGYVNPRFNQIRNRTSEGGGGTRTGRYSSSDPNFQNIPANVDESKNAATLKLLANELAASGIGDFQGLRDYFLPDPGSIWVAADYNQQELRILAHFEKGKLMQEYLKNPNLDVHAWVQTMVNDATGANYPRKFIKTVVFGLLYGMGAEKLGLSLGIEKEDAAKLRKGVLDALPGVRELVKTTKGRICTWGGRIYEVEPPRELDGEMDQGSHTRDWGGDMTFEYKQLNYLIQGSAADCTKQGMLNVAAALPDCRIAIQVHDELGVMVSSESQVATLTEAMCDLGFRVPLTAAPKISRTTWARAK